MGPKRLPLSAVAAANWPVDVGQLDCNNVQHGLVGWVGWVVRFMGHPSTALPLRPLHARATALLFRPFSRTPVRVFCTLIKFQAIAVPGFLQLDSLEVTIHRVGKVTSDWTTYCASFPPGQTKRKFPNIIIISGTRAWPYCCSVIRFVATFVAVAPTLGLKPYGPRPIWLLLLLMVPSAIVYCWPETL